MLLHESKMRFVLSYDYSWNDPVGVVDEGSLTFPNVTENYIRNHSLPDYSQQKEEMYSYKMLNQN